MEEIKLLPDQKPKRPQLLTILCIFTFVHGEAADFFNSFVGFLGMSLQYKESMEALKIFYADMPEASFLLNAPREFFAISSILMGFSLLGAILMWNLRKMGFHFYAASQILYLIMPFIFFSSQANPPAIMRATSRL